MPGCKKTDSNLPFLFSNDNHPIEPNTGIQDENPVPGRQRRSEEGVSIAVIAVAAALVVAVLYLAYHYYAR